MLHTYPKITLKKILGQLYKKVINNKMKDRILNKISLKKFYNLWAGAKNGHFGATKLIKFEVELKNPNLTPKRHKVCQLHPEQATSLQEQVKDWLNAGVLKEVEQLSDEDWDCTMVPVLKSLEGQAPCLNGAQTSDCVMKRKRN